jgi:transcriptional regulator with XRE-family HTH domain
MKKISPEIDLEILEGLAAGYSNKQLAELYKVSPSYVSKLKTGKKVPYIHVANPTLIKDEFFEVYNTNLTEVLAYLECKDLIVNKREIIEYLEVQMQKAVIKAKMYQEILRRLKNGS